MLLLLLLLQRSRRLQRQLLAGRAVGRTCCLCYRLDLLLAALHRLLQEEHSPGLCLLLLCCTHACTASLKACTKRVLGLLPTDCGGLLHITAVWSCLGCFWPLHACCPL